MQSLMMDGIVRRRIDAARPVLVLPQIKEAPRQARPISMAGPRVAFDGIYRHQPSAQTSTAESYTSPSWPVTDKPLTDLVQHTVRQRFGWSQYIGVTAVALMVTGSAAGGAWHVKNNFVRPLSKTAAAVNLPSPPTTVSQAAVVDSHAVQKLVSDWVTTQTAHFGIVVKDLKSGAVATNNPHQVFTSASLYKLFVAREIFGLIDTGKLSYSSPAGAGTGLNIEDCLGYMINISDNACGVALGNIVGWEKQNDHLHQLGYTDTSLAEPQQTSAADVALLLERLYNGTILSPNSREKFISLLKDQKVNNRLPAGLPAGTVVAHKTGDLDGFVHDAGIVYGAKTDYLVVMTSGPWDDITQAPASFSDFSSKLWSFMNPYDQPVVETSQTQ